MSKIILHFDKSNFEWNSLFEMKLPLKVLGMYAVLVHSEGKEDLNTLNIAARITSSGRDEIFSTLKTLENAGLLERRQAIREDGKYKNGEYHIYSPKGKA